MSIRSKTNVSASTRARHEARLRAKGITVKKKSTSSKSSRSTKSKSSFERRVEQAMSKGATGVVVSGSKAIGVGPQRKELRVIPGAGGLQTVTSFDKLGRPISIKTIAPQDLKTNGALDVEKLKFTGSDKRRVLDLVGVPKLNPRVNVSLNTLTGEQRTQKYLQVGDKKITLTKKTVDLLGKFAPVRGEVLTDDKKTFDIRDKREFKTRYSQLVMNIGKSVNQSKPFKLIDKQITELDKLARKGGAKFYLDYTALAKGKLNFRRTQGRRTTGGGALAAIGAGVGKVGISTVRAIVKTITTVQAALAYTTIAVANSSVAENKKFIKDPIGYAKQVGLVTKLTGKEVVNVYKKSAPIINITTARFLALSPKEKAKLIKAGVVIAGVYVSVTAAKNLLGGKGPEKIGTFIGETIVFNKILAGLSKLYKVKGVFKTGSAEKKALSKFSRSMKPFPKPKRALTQKELLREIKARQKILRQLAKGPEKSSLERGLVKLQRGLRKLRKSKFLAADEQLRLQKQLLREKSKLKKLALKTLRQDKKDTIKGLEAKRVVGKRVKARKKEIGREIKAKQFKALAKAEKEGASFWRDLVTFDKIDRKIFTISEMDKQFKAFKKLFIFTRNRVERDALALYVRSRKTYSLKTLNRFTRKYKSILSKGKAKNFRSSILDNAIKESKLAKGKVPLTATAARPKPLKQSGLTKPKEKQAKKAYKELKDIIGKETAKGGQLQKDGTLLIQKVEQKQKQLVSQSQKVKKLVAKSKKPQLRAQLKRINKKIVELQKQTVKIKQKVKLSFKLTSRFRKQSLLLTSLNQLLKQKTKQTQAFKQVLALKQDILQEQKQAQKLKLGLKQKIIQSLTQDLAQIQKQMQNLTQKLKQELKPTKKVTKEPKKIKIPKIKDERKKKTLKKKKSSKKKGTKRKTRFTRTLLGATTGKGVKKGTKLGFTGTERRA